MNNYEKVVIIGSGPAGFTAAVYTARAGLKPLIIEGPNPGGQLMGTTHVENWPGEISILGPQLIQKMRDHAKHFGTRFLGRTVLKVDLSKRPFTIETSKDVIQAESLIIATGASPRKLGCPGEEQYWGKGVSTCAVCDGALYKDKKVVIVGGGDTAMEEASFMRNFTDQVIIIHILDKLTASKAMQDRVLQDPKIKIIYNSSVTEITGDGEHAREITVKNTKTNTTEKIAIDGMFVAIGLTPATALFKNQIELAPNGYIITKEHTKTSVDGVFAAGDVADYKYRQAITSAGTGCMAALDVERFLKEHAL